VRQLRRGAALERVIVGAPWDRSDQAAEHLGIKRTTLQDKIKNTAGRK